MPFEINDEVRIIAEDGLTRIRVGDLVAYIAKQLQAPAVSEAEVVAKVESDLSASLAGHGPEAPTGFQ